VTHPPLSNHLISLILSLLLSNIQTYQLEVHLLSLLWLLLKYVVLKGCKIEFNEKLNQKAKAVSEILSEPLLLPQELRG